MEEAQASEKKVAVAEEKPAEKSVEEKNQEPKKEEQVEQVGAEVGEGALLNKEDSKKGERQKRSENEQSSEEKPEKVKDGN